MITSWVSQLTVIAGVLLIAPGSSADSSNSIQPDQQIIGPKIYPNKNEIILQSGDNFTILCEGEDGPLRLKQQEIPEEVANISFVTERRTLSLNRVALDLYNVDKYAVGYYACFDSSIDEDSVLADVEEEPVSTPHISYIYIYVNGSSLFAPIRSIVTPRSNSKFVVGCKPTTPDIEVKITSKKKSTIFSPKIGFIFPTKDKSHEYMCEARRGDENATFHVQRRPATPSPKPKIDRGPKYFMKGDSFTLNCTVTKPSNIPVHLEWRIPNSSSQFITESNEFNISATNPVLYKTHTVLSATKEDNGTYTCVSSNGNNYISENVFKEFLEEPLLKLTKKLPDEIVVERTLQTSVRIAIPLTAYPPANVTFLKNGKAIKNATKYVTNVRNTVSGLECIILIKNIGAEDNAEFTVKATNGFLTATASHIVKCAVAPTAFIVNSNIERKYLTGTNASLSCEITGFPLPKVTWLFTSQNVTTPLDDKHQQDKRLSNYELTSTLTIPVKDPATITCQAINTEGNATSEKKILVYEISEGFGIQNKNYTWFSEHDDAELVCLASKYDYLNVSWKINDNLVNDSIYDMQYETSLSYAAKLTMNDITVNRTGVYTCIGVRSDGTEKRDTMYIKVFESRKATIDLKSELSVRFNDDIYVNCTVDAVPPPTIEWYKDNELLQNGNNRTKIETKSYNHSYVRSEIRIAHMQESDAGEYECRVTSQTGSNMSKFCNIQMAEYTKNHTGLYLITVGVLFVLLLVTSLYLGWRINKDKKLKRELKAAGLMNFKKGDTDALNRDLDINNQAELLPYKEKFEFPRNLLTLGKQLGCGAFGVVRKAEARGIINAEETTSVAVKMVKEKADNMYIKALCSELKILVHLGKHVNIVNLLGACTDKIEKRELIVIVEYCKYGNLHNYLNKHRDVFINQFTDIADDSCGKINRGYLGSANSANMFEYNVSNHTQETSMNSANTARSRLDSQIGHDWRSNYESDYSYDGNHPRTLKTSDLLAWAFQIARGMEYLASRRVIHCDLAARNVLLAEDNIVKICDFGLASNFYKNEDEYQKKPNTILPVKWLAIESFQRRIFSTQSDVWAFGVVLWELFSLASTPYRNIPIADLGQAISDGHRLEKPKYANNKLYQVMLQCWKENPRERPSFTKLQETLGSFLEDSEREHYLDLNNIYMESNAKQQEEVDYLTMVSKPDYNIMVPSPGVHEYVNQQQFVPSTPNQLAHDEEGYLKMNPAPKQNCVPNARVQGTKFDFDARKLAPRATKNSYGSELTPMLTLNSLPRSGSESEGNTSPYLNIFPLIEEENDVFEMNDRNNRRNDTVVNRAYDIPFTIDNETKPTLNVNFKSNGLVK